VSMEVGEATRAAVQRNGQVLVALKMSMSAKDQTPARMKADVSTSMEVTAAYVTTDIQALTAIEKLVDKLDGISEDDL